MNGQSLYIFHHYTVVAIFARDIYLQDVLSFLMFTPAVYVTSQCQVYNNSIKFFMNKSQFSPFSYPFLANYCFICSSNLPEHAKINFRIDQNGDLILSNKTSIISNNNNNSGTNTSGNGASSGVSVSAANTTGNFGGFAAGAGNLFRRDSTLNTLAQHLSPLQALQQSISTVQHQAAAQQAQMAAHQVQKIEKIE